MNVAVCLRFCIEENTRSVDYLQLFRCLLHVRQVRGASKTLVQLQTSTAFCLKMCVPSRVQPLPSPMFSPSSGLSQDGALPWYKAAEEAVTKVVRHSIPTLRRITVSGWKGDGRSRVAPIIGELVPLSAKRRRVAPQLRRVELVAGATGVAKAGKAAAAGLWPALEVLKLSHCRANAGHFEELAHGIRVGRVPHLRVLNWDDQSCIRKRPVDDVILSALAWGRCPRIKGLSFTGNHFCPEGRILYLKDALKACPGLLMLEMDCSFRPCVQLRDLTRVLQTGHLPNLEYLFVRATAPYYRGSDVELKALREAAESREPSVKLFSEIKTRLPPMA